MDTYMYKSKSSKSLDLLITPKLLHSHVKEQPSSSTLLLGLKPLDFSLISDDINRKSGPSNPTIQDSLIKATVNINNNIIKHFQ